MKLKILLVDDAAFMRMILRRILENQGHEIIGEGENGVMGLQKYKELKPDLVFMDITMPEMDGLSTITQIRNWDPNATIIVCSAMGQKPMVFQAIKSGAIDFIEKPFNEESVINAVNAVVSKLEGV